ncbi:hypothetical protein SESBI_28279 [Sesbania bispinosa]|nr:hypothetical protein SESBI_28279 [Sesbania bispinosa]
MNQSKQMASLTTSRLSPLAKPFTFNRTPYQPTSYLSAKPEVYSLDHCDDDPFSSLLDSFRKSNLGSKGHSVSLDDYGFLQDTVTVTTTLPVETASSQTQENPLFEQHPSLELSKNGDFDGLNGSHFDDSLPTNSPCVTGLGYGTSNGNEVGYGKQGGDFQFHQSLFRKGNDVSSSVADASVFQKGKHAVDGLNPCLTVFDGIIEKSTGTVVEKDILSNSKGTTHAADESSSSLISNCKVSVAPLKLSTTGMSSAKNTPQNQFSNNVSDSDPEVDSPCWKGTMTSSLTASEISGSVQFHLVEKPTEKHNNSLNPLAPQFYPGIGYIKDDFVSSNSSAPVATNLLSGEDILMKTVMVEPLVELNKGVEIQHSSNICGREKPFNVLNDPKCSSVDPVLNLHGIMSQSSSKEECSTSKGKFGTTVDFDVFVKGTKNLSASGSMSEVFLAKGHSPTSTTSSSQVNVVPDLFKTFEGFSKSLIESPKPDVKIMVNAMHVLSELLVQACADGVDSSDEHDHDMIRIPQIINNLNVFSTKRCGGRISTLDSTPADSAFCLDRSLELPKGLEMTRIETLNVPHQLYLQNDYMGKNRVSKMIGQSEQSSFAASSNEGTERGNEIAQLQVIRRGLGKSLDFDKQMHPEAMLFSNLWLDAEAERIVEVTVICRFAKRHN